jgi:hypothetical protein
VLRCPWYSHTQPRKHVSDKQSNNNMVALPSCPGLEVNIIVDGQPLEEYDDIDEGSTIPNAVTKYVEAQSEVEFAVRVKVTHDFPFPAGDLEIKATVDQLQPAYGLVHLQQLFHPQGNIVDGINGRIGHKTDAVYKFRFTALDIGRLRFILSIHSKFDY